MVTLLAYGQSGSSPDKPEKSSVADDPAVTMFPHSATARYWISGQDNIIFQYHPSFYAKYSGPNSLRPQAEDATSNVSTLFLGYQLTHTTEVLFDLEEASGGGLSDALGLAGETNLDVVRNPLLSKAPYMARVMVREIIPLSKETVEVGRGPLALATPLPVRRLEIRAGKFGMADFFDVNSVGSDSHFQFMNWTIDNNGAYDYAADTRGYTFGVFAEYRDRNWAFHFGEALMPTVANGPDLQWNLRRARAENYELELHPRIGSNRTTIVRLLGYENHANMGVYRDAVKNFLAGLTPRPEIRAHPLWTKVKYGFGVNMEHVFTPELRGFARWGWNEGQHESFAYTEDDESFVFGADFLGQRWHRKLDKIGAAFVSNGISADHQHYLELGGLGFLLGDGGLNYGRETIVESYYTAHVWRGLFIGPDFQHINNPGYNRDRGPVLVPGFRFHLEF
ncbi:MAG: Carbohydrate-selective porin [Acidobacteriaceae bacterium]|nr:Carbohydrate-selective porin [Acidobacteriaceae bacterium]